MFSKTDKKILTIAVISLILVFLALIFITINSSNFQAENAKNIIKVRVTDDNNSN
jgi:archaellum component FlaF (FlaF/FlaG flagellin family)